MERAISTSLADQVKAHPFGANQNVHGFATRALTHLDAVYNLAVWISRDAFEAEGLSQETYLRASRSFDKLQPGTNCRAWLLSLLRHIYINRCRQKSQGPEVVDWEKIDQAYDSIVEQGERAEELFSELTDHEVEKALKGLPEEYRTAIVLVDIERLSYEEATEVMECSIGTIRSRVSRGRRMWQVALMMP
jgi:RNA polymerase sigma-70 factor (ECF subfamily)